MSLPQDVAIREVGPRDGFQYELKLKVEDKIK